MNLVRIKSLESRVKGVETIEAALIEKIKTLTVKEQKEILERIESWKLNEKF